MFFGGSKLSGRQPGERQQLESSVKLLLLWLAASGGSVDEKELKFVDEQFPDTERTIKARELLEFIHARDMKRMEQAVRTIAKEGRELRMSFLDLAIAMCMADREIAITENHILRFFADAMFLGMPVLKRRFQAVTRQELPEPGNPGSPQWWEQHESAAADSGGEGEDTA